MMGEIAILADLSDAAFVPSRGLRPTPPTVAQAKIVINFGRTGDAARFQAALDETG